MDVLKQFTKVTPAEIKRDVQLVATLAAALGFKFDGSISDSVAIAIISAAAAVRAVQAVVGGIRHKAAAQVIAAKTVAAPKP